MGHSNSKKKERKQPASKDPNGPIIIYSQRRVAPENMETYLAAAKTWADYLRPITPGFKSNMFAIDKKDPGLVHDVQWFNSISVFRAHMAHGSHSPTITANTMRFLSNNEDGIRTHFTGNAFGAWDQTAFAGVHLPRMFGIMGKWWEFRETTAGFIRNTPSSTHSPPIIITMEYHVRDGQVQNFISAYQGAADAYENDTKVIAMCLTEQNLNTPLRDPEKKRNPNKLIDLLAFENLAAFEALVKAGGHGRDALMAMLSKAPVGEVWAEGKEGKTVVDGLKAMIHPDAQLTVFSCEHGWSDHMQTCTPVAELTLPEDGQTAMGPLVLDD